MSCITTADGIGRDDGLIKGLIKGIEVALGLKFGTAALRLLPEIQALADAAKLETVLRAIRTAVSPEDLRRVWTGRSTTRLKLATRFYPEPQTFKRATRAGFQCAELLTYVGVLANWEAVASMARQFPLQYTIRFPKDGELTPWLLDGAVALYRELACQEMIIQARMYKHYARRLLAREPSLCLAVENGRVDRGGFDRWAGERRWLTLNVEHLWRYSLQDAPLETLLAALEAFLAVHAGKLRHVHLPGYRPGGNEHRPMYCGAEMVYAVLSRLARAGFTGRVVSEVRSDYQTYKNLRKDVVLFADWRRCEYPALQAGQRASYMGWHYGILPAGLRD
jgi:hypothetical protein